VIRAISLRGADHASDHKVTHEEAIKGLVEQYKENLRTLYREGKLTHQQLEEQLCHVVDSGNDQIRDITSEVLTEEDSVKKLPMPLVQKRSENQQKSGANRVVDHKSFNRSGRRGRCT